MCVEFVGVDFLGCRVFRFWLAFGLVLVVGLLSCGVASFGVFSVVGVGGLFCSARFFWLQLVVVYFFFFCLLFCCCCLILWLFSWGLLLVA